LSNGWGLENPRVEVKVYQHYNFDERSLALSKPKVDDPWGYLKNIQEVSEDLEITPLDKDIPEMTDFYGDRLDGLFKKRNW